MAVGWASWVGRRGDSDMSLIRVAVGLLVALFASSGAWAAGMDEPGATLFIYHRFDEPRYPSTNVSATDFARQMEFLAANGYRVIPLRELVDGLRAGRPFAPKTVAITVDDGFASTKEVAWPILQRHGFPFTVFVYAQAVVEGYPNFLKPDEIREMARAGVDFQDHGYGHVRHGNLPAGMTQEAYREGIRTDFVQGRASMREILGHEPEYLSLPYGEYNETVLSVARGLGYRAVFTQEPGAVSQATDLYRIPREPILGTDWATLSHFQEVLRRVDLPIRGMEPPLAPVGEGPVARFCADLSFPDRYRLSTLGIYVSGMGWKKGVLQDGRVCVEHGQPLARRSIRVAVSATEKASGRPAIGYWLLIRKGMVAPKE